MKKSLLLLSLQVSKNLRCFRLLMLTLVLCGSMQAMAETETWTDEATGLTWSFTVNGTEATDIRVSGSEKSEKVYIYGDPNSGDKPFTPGAWDAAAMRFSYTEGTHLPTILDAVYFSLKTLIFDVSDVSGDFDLKVMNGWWSNTYYDHVKWQDGLNELQITPTMAEECAKGGQGRDLDLMLYSGSMLLKSVYYETFSIPEEVVIPEKVYVGSKELTVTSIGYGAFCGCYGLTSIEIPSSVTSIGDRAFQYCSRLKSMNIPSNVTYIGNAAFYECFSLTSLNIPSSVRCIGDRAFYNCAGLNSITVDSGNMIYDSRDNCNAIIETASNTLIVGSNTTVIPNGVLSIADYALYDCYRLNSIEIPNSVTSIGNYAFCYCSGLTSLNIPSSVKSLGYGVFHLTGWFENQSDGILYLDNWLLGYKGNGPTGELVINEGTKGMAVSALSYCIGLTSVMIPNSMKSISSFAFQGCSDLTSVTIGNSVTSIGEWAFSRCSALTSVTIPSSVTSIGGYAFYGCSSLNELFCYAMTPPACGDWTFEEIDKSSCTLYVPEPSFETYQATEPWSSFTNIVALQITPISEDEDISFSDEITEETDLSSVIIDNIYITVDTDNGDGYDSDEQALVLSSTMTAEQMDVVEDLVVGDPSLRENYNGIIFELAAGSGIITVDAKTVGTHVLNVQIGNSEPKKITQSVRGTVDVSYNVKEPTYVYIYASTEDGSAARLNRAPSAEANSVLLYGYKVNIDVTGIEGLKTSKVEGLKYYDLSGRRIDGKPTKKGVYIINGRKVLVK